jgi:hypothetical protein
MFKNDTRAILKKHGWLGLQKEGANPPQQKKRVKDLTDRTFRDLVLLSNSLPMEERKEFFNYSNVSSLIEAITKIENEYSLSKQYPNMELAFFLIKQGLHTITEKYKDMTIMESPYLSQITIEHLERARGICSDIVNIIRNEEMKKEGLDNNLYYLFSWSDIFDKDKIKFIRFIDKVFIKKDDGYLVKFVNEIDLISYKNIKYSDNKTKVVADIFDPIDDDYVGRITLLRDVIKSKCLLTIEVGKEQKEENLVLKENNGKYYVYTTKSKYAIE